MCFCECDADWGILYFEAPIIPNTGRHAVSVNPFEGTFRPQFFDTGKIDHASELIIIDCKWRTTGQADYRFPLTAKGE